MPEQSVLDPASRGAELIGDIAWTLFIGGGLIFVLVMAVLAWAVVSARCEQDYRRWIIGGGLVLPIAVLSGLLAYGLAVGTELSHAAHAGDVRVQVIGKRWWWEVRYEMPDGSDAVVLANELHLPVDQVATITLETADVIHSFWVPALAGKIDMIPGQANRLVIRPDRTGLYRGQCAEYCGGEHAQMAFDVFVRTRAEFDTWLARQASPAPEPTDPVLIRGREAFFKGGCATCHTIRGTPAAGRLGPDLTHVGSRRRIAAGALPNHRGAMAGWIAGAQGIKAGLMPSMNVYTGPELRALSAYMESLQ